MGDADYCRLYLQDDATSAHHWSRNAPGYTAPLKIGEIIVSDTQLKIAVINRYTLVIPFYSFVYTN